MSDQNVFITPQQNIIAAKALFDSVEPMMVEDHAATPILTRIKAMITAAAIQDYEEGNRAPSASRLASSRQPSGWERAQGSQRNVADARSSINNNCDARNVIDAREAIRDELTKLTAANFIREVYHPDWLANPVLVKKKNGK